ncbi:MAG: hypothetical protein JF616_05865 [Fibrobacteres bacterium]|nr:hypothetical protein [Fibrobacterota bacterium]
MLAYKRKDWDLLARRREISRWAAEGYIETPAAETLLADFPQPFYSPNPFFRIGLFFFGVICVSAALGLFFLFSGEIADGDTGMGTLFLVSGIACLLTTEMLMRQAKPFFRAGVEEAACYTGMACVICAFLTFAGYRHGSPLHAPFALPIAALLGTAALRYADRLLAALGYATLAFVVLDSGRYPGMTGIFLFPLSMIAYSTLSAWACSRALRSPALAPWDPIWTALRLLALALTYAAGNYWVVREWCYPMLPSGAGPALPFAWAFYAYTFAVPVGYVAWGLARKDRLYLDAGLIAIAAAVLTYKAYHNVMPVETGLTLIGIVLLAVAWACLRAFRTPRFGLSTEPRRRQARGSLLDAEALAAWASFGGGTSQGKIPEGFQGGGGKFGGGGAGGSF